MVQTDRMGRATFAAWVVGAAAAFFGCDDSDVGRCCEVIDADESIIPTSTRTPTGDFRNDITRHPAFDCNSLTCVAFRNSEAYCTERCNEAADCPEGFACEVVIESEPPAGRSIGPDDRFCVRLRANASCD